MVEAFRVGEAARVVHAYLAVDAYLVVEAVRVLLWFRRSWGHHSPGIDLRAEFSDVE